MPLSEADTRTKLIEPALRARGWIPDGNLIRREEATVETVVSETDKLVEKD